MSRQVYALEASRLGVGYPSDRTPAPRVLTGIDLRVAKGAFLTILGPSGCGKSTLLRAVADLLPALDGTLDVLGGSAAAARRRRDVAFVFQDATLLPWRTVRQNVRLPLDVGRRAARRVADRADELLALVGLSNLAERYPDQLSGGQRQRVAIARALQCEPTILLMDEPFGALDEITRERLNDELFDIWRQTATTILFVTHSVMEAVYLGTEVLVLAANPGRVLACVDLRPLKDIEGRCRRESPDVTEMTGRLRALLRAHPVPA